MVRIFYGMLFLCGLIFSANAQEAEVSTAESSGEIQETQDVNSSEETVSEQSVEEEPEEEVVYVDAEVFSPSFMKSLLECKPDTESNSENQVEIAGKKDQRCLIKYANFDLNVPFTLLGNIHSFEDVETLLKNKDIAHYNYRADYIYDGLVYALSACSDKKDYYGKQEELSDEYVTIIRGLSSEFINGICTINLQNTQSIEGVDSDFGVICTLPYKEIKNLEPYFKDIVEKYGEKRGFGADGHIMVKPAEQNKTTHEGDIALMYYMQKNGFCKKNSE
ncbi:MAG: hypothetical protein IJ532_05840 [Alphaproteobacteria bacterium]|nr:hypothetical protein [Alphaproteobacteria bacterium]